MKLDLKATYTLNDFSNNHLCKYCNTLNPILVWTDSINDPTNPAGSFSCQTCNLWLTLNKDGRIETIRYNTISCISFNTIDNSTSYRRYDVYLLGNSIGNNITTFDTDKLDKYLLLI